MRLSFLIPILIAGSAFAEERKFTSKDFKEIDLNSDLGNVEIITHASKEVLVTYKKISTSSYDSNCKLTFEETDKKVKIHSNSLKTKNNSECEIEFALTIPENIEAEIKLGQGNLKATGKYKEFYFKAGQGDLKLDGQVHELKIQVGQGDLIVSKISEKAEVKLGSGKIEISFADAKKLKLRNGNGSVKAQFDSIAESAEVNMRQGNGMMTLSALKTPKVASLDLNSGNGNIEMNFPKDASMQISHRSGFGKLKSEFGSTGTSKFHIDVGQGHGDLIIQKK